MRPHFAMLLTTTLLSSLSVAQTANGPETYPEGKPIGRSLTPLEQQWIERFPITPARGGTPAPTGPLHCVAEYEPMEGLLIAWEGSSGWISILRQMAAAVTTTGDGEIYCVVDSASERTTASSQMTASGVDMNRVTFIIRSTDSIWCRDYGPRYVYEGNCRAIIDHTYNRPRPNDNALNGYFATVMNHAYYEIPLVHGGGNFHLNALDEGNATGLIANENPGLSEPEIIALWSEYQNLDTTIWTPYPTSIDSTQHIDMWMQVVADDVIIISDWPTASGSTQDQICDNTAADFESRGWTVFRVPARRASGTHYTYTNMVMCNDLILLPSYTHSSISGYNAEALATVQAACPDKTVTQINCQSIVTAAGVMHCIVMHVPEHLGGVNPTVYLRNLRGGESLDPGELAMINWISDDDDAVSNIDILLSTDGGVSFDTVIASETDDDGSYLWTVPDVATTQARLRLVARDGHDLTGSDESDGDFAINGTAIPGDADGDGDVDFADLLLLLSAWGSCPDPPDECPGDFDDSGAVDFNDLLILLSNWGA